jgi:hypothetical protein
MTKPTDVSDRLREFVDLLIKEADKNLAKDSPWSKGYGSGILYACDVVRAIMEGK